MQSSFGAPSEPFQRGRGRPRCQPHCRMFLILTRAICHRVTVVSLATPAASNALKENVAEALDLSKRIGCKNLTWLVGRQVAGLTHGQQLELARANVAWIAEEAAVADRTILIEALNTFEHGSYLISRTEEAVQFVRSTGQPNVMVQYDVYHMQLMEGNLAGTLSRHISEIGHIQVADCPGRGQPGTGEVNVPYVLRHIDSLGYSGFVGLEYCPTTLTTEESLSWLPREARGTEGLLMG